MRLKTEGPGLFSVVAEYKRASPSRGVICETLEPEDVALQYAKAGAGAISVLTEERYFHGSLSYLFRMASAMQREGLAVPMLRKDFIFHPLQVRRRFPRRRRRCCSSFASRRTPVFFASCASRPRRAGMETVVEVFDARDVALARESGANIIQVNARDLASLAVDRRACLALAAACPPQEGELWIAASGMSCRSDLEEAAKAGFRAALVGSALMEHGRPGEALRALLGAIRISIACGLKSAA